MKLANGLILRRVGLLIEMGSLLVLLTQRDESRMVAGIPVRHVLIVGVALGFLLWGIGLALIMRGARSSRE